MNNKLIILQWHITNRCNKRCKHCYIDDYNGAELTINNLLEIRKEYIKLLDEYNKDNNCTLKGQINITGGEPFHYKDIWTLFDFFKNNNDKFDFSVLTNGLYLNEENVKRLKSYNPKFVQISLDGNKFTHDNIRGKGSFEEVKRALYNLHKYKTYKVWTDRMVPIGSNNKNNVHTLNSEMLKEYITIIRKEKLKIINKISKIKI